MAIPNPPSTPDRPRDAWDKLAPGYDRLTTPLSFHLSEEALRLVDLRPGMRFLDVAAGSGALSLPAARLGARVLAVDISPRMIERLEARAREEGLSDVEGRVMDGCGLDLDDDSFDVTGSQNGVSLFPDLRAGLRELVRVTRPGGRTVVIVFGSAEGAEWLGFFMGAMKAVVPDFDGLPPTSPPPPFRLADPAKLRREMLAAGLAEARVEPLIWKMAFRDGAHLYDVATNSNPIGHRLVSELAAAQRDDVRQVLDGMLRERSGGGPGAMLECEMNAGIARK